MIGLREGFDDELPVRLALGHRALVYAVGSEGEVRERRIDRAEMRVQIERGARRRHDPDQSVVHFRR